ncbi:hypothetical protein C6P45_003803, partial [Maudiozyma exigua]
FGTDPATLYYRMNSLENLITEDVLRDTFSASEVSFNVPATNSDTPQTGLIWGEETTTTNFTLLGYNLFKPNVTGTYTFSVDKVNEDGGAALYIVESAHMLCCDITSMGSLATDKSAYNIPADISHSNINITLELDSSRHYVVFIIYTNTKGSAQFEMSVTTPDGTKIPDGTGFFGRPSNAKCNAIRPVKTVTSLGNVFSPTTYATSFSTTKTVVSGTTLDEFETIYYVSLPTSTKTTSITSTETEPMLLPTDDLGFPIVDDDLYHGGTGFLARVTRPDDEMYPHNPQIINPENLLDVYLGLCGDYPLKTTTPAFDIPLQGTLAPQNTTLYGTTIDISNTIILYKGIFKAPTSGNYKLSIDYNGVGATAALFPVSLLCGYEFDEASAGYPYILNVASMASGPDFSGSASNETYLTAGQSYVFTMAYENISLFPGYNRTTTASFHPSLTFPNGGVVTDFSNLVHKYSYMDTSFCFLHKTKTVEYPWTGTYSTAFTTYTRSTPTVIVTNSETQTMYRYDINVYALSPTSSSIDSSMLISSSSSLSVKDSSSKVTIPSSTSSFPSSIASSLKSINSSISISSYRTNSSQLQASSSTPLNPVHSSNITHSVDSIPTDKDSSIPVYQSSATVSQSSATVSNSSSYASIVSPISNSQVVQISSTPNREIISSNSSISSTKLHTPSSIASTTKTSLFASTALYSESARFGNTTNRELSTSIHLSDTTTITPNHSMTHDSASKVSSTTYGEVVSRHSELSNDILTTSTYIDSRGFTITTIINCSNNIDNNNSPSHSESVFLNTMQTITAVATALHDTVLTDTIKQNIPTSTEESSIVQYGSHSNSISIGSSSSPTAALFSPENENNAIKYSSQMMMLLLALLH